MDDDHRIARRVKVTGRVQGVWYRGWTVDRARSLDLDGWVRNRADGSVEALVAGPGSRVAELIGRCGEGPPGAAVDHIAESDADDPGPIGFEQRPTV